MARIGGVRFKDATVTRIHQPSLTTDEKRLAQLFAQAVARLRNTAYSAQLLQALAAESPQAVADTLDWAGWDTVLAGAVDLIARGLVDGFKASIAEYPEVAVALDYAMPGAVEAARKQFERLASQIGDSTAQAVTGIVQMGLRAGWSVDDTAKLIQNVVGLNPQRANALAAYRAGLQAKGMSNAQVQARVAAMRDAYLRDRAQTIAQHELMAASNAGILDGYRQAALRGSIGYDSWKEVVVGPGCCYYCSALGAIPGLDSTWDVRDEAYQFPPFHVRCRCTLRVVDVDPAGNIRD